MSFFSKVLGGVEKILKPASDAYKSRQKRKQAAESAQAKIKQAKVQGAQEVVLRDSEWENVKVRNEGQEWKDEYSLIMGSSPYPLIFIGGILTAFGYPEFLSGVLDSIERIKDLGVPVGFIAQASILSGLGLKIWRMI